MKKSELMQMIKEEIKHALNEFYKPIVNKDTMTITFANSGEQKEAISKLKKHAPRIKKVGEKGIKFDQHSAFVDSLNILKI